MKLIADYKLGAEEIGERVFAEYREATDDDSSAKYGHMNIGYTAMSFSYRMETSNTDSRDEDSNEAIEDKPVDDSIKEVRQKKFTFQEVLFQMEFFDLDYLEDKLLECIQAVPRWYYLRKIPTEGDYPDENDMVDENISHLRHVAERSPYFRELHINADLDFARVLSSNVELGILLSFQLEILYFTVK
ncbi:unnamed protein product [Rotaria sp. Silwood2]|nr:unnamed protein product [Rotaria sp. Silwood2]CAF2746108.1 unnamed protein product [Rotaria sp. Silwood2]CAF3365034.1 unnamed protein product [Rotaria sp. Silwood2]CAF4033902.1 unnamed protein product [Rotaria sp. Silwood2]CAF4253029.1 unnamed protein product [Rotaria sp. Silwood2]